MSELYLLRGTLGVFCWAPFAVEGEVRDEKTAFAHRGTLFCRIADTEDMVCPQSIQEVGDVIGILLSVCWSNRAAEALEGIRLATSLRLRDIEVRNSDDQVLAQFQWAVDFERYDVLDRERSKFTVMKGTTVINRVDLPVVSREKIPAADMWGSMYGPELFVTAEVKDRIDRSACVGFTFRPVQVV